jgi:signal transduction histidine kinase
MYNSLLLEGPVDAGEQAQVAESVREQVERAKQVVTEILDYSRPRPTLREVMSLNDAVRYGLRLVQHAARPAHVTIIEEYEPDLPLVLLDRGHMAQIVTNLTLNAVQAMPNGGTLTISTGVADGEVYFRFRDTGVGISPSDEKRVFDAFFTTKPPGQGTGLGLAVCRALVSQHHGRMTVDSELGSGSSFTVWLPPAVAEEELVVGSHPR